MRKMLLKALLEYHCSYSYQQMGVTLTEVLYLVIFRQTLAEGKNW